MSESIGAALKRTREQRGLSLAQVSETTKIRSHYLHALESDDLSSMPSAVQARGFLRIYAAFLGLDLDKVVAAAGHTEPPEPAEPLTEAEPAVAEASSRPSLLAKLRGRLVRQVTAPAKAAETTANIAPTAVGAAPAASDIGVHTKPSAESGPRGKKKTEVAPEEAQPAEASFVPSSAAVSGEAEAAATEAHSDSVALPGEPRVQAAAGEEAKPQWTSALRSGFLSLIERLRPLKDRATPAREEVDATATSESETDGVPARFANARDFNPWPEESDDAAVTSDDIFAEVGRSLRSRREMLSLTREEVERHTRVRFAFLKGLEEGELEDLPSPVQTRGILANYAAFLDLDVDAILLRFAEGLQARHREHRPQWQPPRTRPPMTVHTSLPPLRGFIASDLLFGGGVAIMLLLFAIWGIGRIMAVRSSAPVRATAPSISDVLAGTAFPTLAQQVTLIPAQDTPVVATQAPSSGGAVLITLAPNLTVQVQLSATERTYMRVMVDGSVKFEGRAEPGQDYTYQAASRIEVLAGNGAALKVTHNGRDMGLMGSFGEVVDRVYTAQGVFTPTVTLPPTRTPTPNYTPTPLITPTQTPSITPTAKAGG
jgi:cytoskeletal protein RodZ